MAMGFLTVSRGYSLTGFTIIKKEGGVASNGKRNSKMV